MLTPEILSGLFGQPRSEGAILVSEPLFFQDFLREFYMPSPANNPSENFFITQHTLSWFSASDNLNRRKLPYKAVCRGFCPILCVRPLKFGRINRVCTDFSPYPFCRGFKLNWKVESV